MTASIERGKKSKILTISGTEGCTEFIVLFLQLLLKAEAFQNEKFNNVLVVSQGSSLGGGRSNARTAAIRTGGSCGVTGSVHLRSHSVI